MNIKNKTIRFYLHTYDCLKEDIRLERELIADFKMMQIDSIARPATEIKAKNKVGSRTEDIATERVDILSYHENKLAQLLIIYGGIETYRHSLNPDSLEENILNMRYLKEKSWNVIATKLRYTAQWLQNKDMEIIRDISKRCVFKAQKKEA